MVIDCKCSLFANVYMLITVSNTLTIISYNSKFQ